MRVLDELENALKSSGCYDEIVGMSCNHFADNERKFDRGEPFLILNDRGIREAFKKRKIRADVKNDDFQVQPASLDCKVLELDWDDNDIGLFGNFGTPKTMSEFGIPAYNGMEALFTQWFDYDVSHFHPIIVLRSSLGRAGVATVIKALMTCWSEETNLRKSGVRVANYSPNNIAFDPGDRFAQILWGMSFKGYGYVDDPKYQKGVRKFSDVVGQLECGIEVKDGAVLRSMNSTGLYKVSPLLTVRDGFVVLHASAKAYRFREVGTVRLSEKRTDLLEPVDISKGYTPQPGEHLLVEAAEHLKLSDRVGIHFMERPVGNLDQGERERQRSFQVAATNLVNAAWFDPGYEGIYMANVKNVDKFPVDIRPGDPIGFGAVFYFPKGVERPYGSAALQSHYQGVKTAQVLQKR